MRHTEPAAVRFWHWYRFGWVRVTVRQGKSIEIIEGGPTDEGYSWEATTYTLEGSEVRRQWAVRACDCDGRLDRDGEDTCTVDQLQARELDEGFAENRGIRAPEWQRETACQRDYAAEAAGY